MYQVAKFGVQNMTAKLTRQAFMFGFLHKIIISLFWELRDQKETKNQNFVRILVYKECQHYDVHSK